MAETGSFIITGNEFNSEQNDILFNNVSAGMSTLVEDNIFNGLRAGYRARGTTLSQNKIVANHFQTGIVDIFNDGDNNCEIWYNEITAPFGTAAFDNGGGICDVRNNDFDGNFVGIYTSGANSDFNFFENCFSTAFSDVYIIGEVSPIIHAYDKAANNCFTHQGNANSSTQDIDGSPNPFVYLERDDNVIDCYDAILAHPNVNRVPWLLGNDIDCGLPGGGIPPLQEGTPCRPYKTVDSLVNARNWLLERISIVQGDNDLTEEEKIRQIASCQRCANGVVRELFELNIKKNNFSDARALYENETTDDAKVLIFSSFVIEGDFIAARDYLLTIDTESEQLSDFITIQKINLDRLPMGPFYEPNSEALNIIRLIAQKSHPYAAYAKALYYVLTSEVISSQLPKLGKGKSMSKPNLSPNLNIYPSVFPNPFSNQLTLTIPIKEDVEIAITDFFGKSIYSGTDNQSSVSINTSTWKEGLYIVTIKSGNVILLQKKLVLIH